MDCAAEDDSARVKGDGWGVAGGGSWWEREKGGGGVEVGML